MTVNPIQFPKFELPYNKLLARLGYASGITKIDGKMKDIISEEMDNARRLFTPKQVVATSTVQFRGQKTVLLEPNYKIDSADITRLLRECAQAAGFAVTIGPALEIAREKYLKDKETARALVLDAAASVAAEELATITNKELADEYAKKGFTTTRRFSPGYGDWCLSGQKEFLVWLGASNAGIKLNDAFQMIPEKSVSALIGFKLSVKGNPDEKNPV